MAAVIAVNGQRYKSYDIMYMLLRRAMADGLVARPLRVIDLTYGRGRWWRRARKMLELLVAVDIARHEFEVEPDAFYEHDARDIQFLAGLIEKHDANLLAVDPPWNHEKRGYLPAGTGISGMPYHMRVDSAGIVDAALRLSERFGLPLVYRYYRALPGSSIVFAAHVKLFRNSGTVYYGVVKG